jgi:hypothetical protein
MFVQLGSNILSKAIPAERMPAFSDPCDRILRMIIETNPTLEGLWISYS